MPTTIEQLLTTGDAAATALAAPGRPPLSYGALRALVAETVAALNAAGAGRNDRVAIVLDNGPEMAACFIACASGTASAPLNPAYRADEFEFYLADLHAKLLIVERTSSSPAIGVAEKLGVPIVDLVVADGAAAGAFTLVPRAAPAAPAAQGGFSQPGDTGMVLHTSGTTSRPKIVPLSVANLVASAGNIGASLRLAPGDIGLNIMPLFHIHGLIAGVLAPLAAGTAVYCTPGFNALKFFQWMDDAAPTWYTAVPTMHQAIVSRARNNAEVIARHPLRFLRSSSSSMPPQVIKELEAAFGAPLIEAYGMTEATHQMASNPLPPAVRKPGTVGLPAGPEIEIMSNDGLLLPAGQTGEIVIRGKNVTAGYENNAPANADGFRARMVPHRRPGRAGRRRLPLDHRPAEGDHQPRRREGEPARGRRDPDGPPGGRAGRVLRHAAREARRGGRGGGRPQARKRRTTDRELQAFVSEPRRPTTRCRRSILFMDEIPKGATGKLQRIGLAQKLGLA